MAMNNKKKGRHATYNDASAFSRSQYGSGETSTYQDHQAVSAPRAVPRATGEGGAGQYSRDGFGAHNYVRQHRLSQKKARRKKRILATVAILLTLLLGAAGAAFAYMIYLDNNMNGLDNDALDSLVVTDNASDPFYMLLIGVDKSEAREQTGSWGAYRTDSIILCRLDPQEKKITMISVARDLKTDLPGHGTQKINAAYAFDGPAGAIKAISNLAGVPINHYAEIDFDAFKQVVDALGGVEVDVAYRIDDKHVDDVIEPGRQTLNGSQALTLCRSRHSYDKVGDGDALRTANQRMVLSAIMKKVLASDPSTMLSTVNTMTGYVTTDMSATTLLSLAQAFYGMDVDSSVYTASTPKTSEYTGGVWWDILIESKWKEMMERVDSGLPPTEGTVVDEKTGIVTSYAGDGDDKSGSADAAKDDSAKSSSLKGKSIAVKNGSSASGVAESAAKKLRAAGATCDTGNAENSKYEKTIVVYENDSDKATAQAIADTLGIGEVKKSNNKYSFKGDFLVVVGKDWK